MSGTASILEVCGVTVNVIGLLAAALMMTRTQRRYRAVQREPHIVSDDPRSLAAWRHFRCESGRILYHASNLGLGIWALFLPNGGSDYGWAVMVSRVIIGLWLMAGSIIDVMKDDQMASLLGPKRAGRH